MSENNFIPYVGVKPKKISKQELEEQVILAKKGNQRSFEKILAHKHSFICHIMKEFFIQGSEPQDVYQECAIKLINIIDKYDPSKGCFDAFANSSIRKHIITNINKEKAKKRRVLNDCYSLDDETKTFEGECVTFMETITDNLDINSKDEFVDIIQKDYEKYLVENICEDLSEMESKIFVLRYIDHFSYKEIAKKLNLYKLDKKLNVKILNQKAVDNSICRSKPKIKSTLERLGLDQFFLLKKKRKKSGLKKGRIGKADILKEEQNA